MLSTLFPSCSGPHPTPGPQPGDSIAVADSALRQHLLAAEDSITYEQREGRYLYRRYCIVCHGEEGKGDGFNAYNLDPRPRDFTDARSMNALTDERILQTIAGGGRSVNRSPLMPSWGGRVQKDEMRYLLAYVRLFNSPKK